MPLSVGTAKNSNFKDPLHCGRDVCREALDRLKAEPKAIVVFSPYQGVDHGPLLKGIREVSGVCPLIGGTTYGGILGPQLEENAVVLMALGGSLEAATGLGKGLATQPFEAGRQAAKQALELSAGKNHKFFILIHEPQMGDSIKLVNGARSVLEPAIPIIGGGSGTGIIMEQTPVSKQFLGDKALAGCCVGLLVSGDFRYACGFSHGGIPISPPYTLTKARGNIFVEFDHKPALDVLEQALGMEYGSVGTSIAFFNLSCGRVDPETDGFTLLSFWGADKERRTLLCGTPIEEGAQYRFVRMEPETIIAQSREAALATARAVGPKPRAAICFDCYGRKLQLGGHGLINEELKAVHDGLAGVPLIGMYSGSEIANLRPSPKALSRYGHSSTSFVVLGDE